MPTSSWLPKGQMFRSKPFVICIVLALLGLLLIHRTGRKTVLLEWTADDAQTGSGRLVTPRSGTGSEMLLRDTFEVKVDATHLNIDLENNAHEQTVDVILNTSNERSRNLPKHVTQEVITQHGGFTQKTNGQCIKKRNVSFLKAHKAGSTTVMNIFLRFAISNKLNIVLPRESEGYGFNYLGYGTTLSGDRIVPVPPNEHYNILCNHVVYNKEKFREILQPDTSFVGIIREPVSHFISAATYYGFYDSLRSNVDKQDNVMRDFLREPSAYDVNTYFVRNRMSFDFGIPESKFQNETFVENYVKELDNDYALVMVMERFPESLVLMRRRLCWTTKEILYVPLNALPSKPDFNLTDEDVHRLRDWNSADFRLYDYFSAKFDQLVKQEGDDLQEEVKSFREIKKTVAEFCSGIPNYVKSFPATKWSAGFTVTLADCDLMTEDELSMLSRLIEQAWTKYRKSLPVSS